MFIGDFPCIKDSVYIDDGYSGTNFFRPQIQTLFTQAKQGKIACVFVKDLSRFGRNYIETGNYLEQIFPFLGVRFIAVNDGYDSAVCAETGEFMDMAFKNLVYDLYSKDLSEKITSVRRIKAEQGKFITAFAPYGYRKSSGQTLEVDKEAALVVKRIFLMASAGIPKAHIAKTLNDEGIPSPAMWKKRQGEHFYKKQVSEKSVWSGSAILHILKDQRYVGDGVYGKERPITAGSRKGRRIPEGEWLVIPNNHEPVVSRELFEEVNAALKKYSKYQRKEPALFSGKVCCGVCNHGISRKNGGYGCRVWKVAEEYGCYRKVIREAQIREAILVFLQKAVLLLDMGEIKAKVKAAKQEKIRQIEEKLSQNHMERQRIKNIRFIKYREYKRGIITKEEFLKIKEGLEREEARLEDEWERQKQSESLLKENDASFESLTREMVQSFVRQIVIKDDGRLIVSWEFRFFYP